MSAIAFRQLWHGRRLATAGIAGVTAALLLILTLNGIFAGLEERLTVLLTRSGADIVVAQRDVTTMHMTESSLPLSTTETVGSEPGVREATGFLYAPTLVRHRANAGLVYLIGQSEADPALFAPTTGDRPGAGEIVIDRSLATRLGARIGDTVEVLNREFVVSGTIAGTSSIANSVATVRRDDLSTLMRASGLVSYIFVKAEKGIDPSTLAQRLQRRLPDTSVSTTDAFVASERRVVSDMATGVVKGITLVGLVIGVGVVGLISSLSTHRQMRDITILRAIGASPRHIAMGVLLQVAIVCAAAICLAAALLLLLAQLLPRMIDTVVIAVRPSDLVLGIGAVLIFAIAGSLVPLMQTFRVDPASAFQQG